MTNNNRIDKLQNVAYRLNHEAGKNKANWSGTKKRPQFTPCSRAGVLITACQTDEVLPSIFMEAYNEPCICHGTFMNISFFEFQDWSLDDSYRRGDKISEQTN
jgi:hypothetical protein